MIGVADRRDEWVGPSSRPERLRASLRLEKANPQRERNGALHGLHAVVRFKKNLTPPTLSEMRFITNDGETYSTQGWASKLIVNCACSRIKTKFRMQRIIG